MGRNATAQGLAILIISPGKLFNFLNHLHTLFDKYYRMKLYGKYTYIELLRERLLQKTERMRVREAVVPQALQGS